MGDRIIATTVLATLVWVAPVSSAADLQVERVNRKIDLIQSGHARPGSVVVFTVAELNVWGRAKAVEVAPEGLRQARLELGNGTATAYALVDFLKLRHAAGIETNWVVAKLIEGEKPLKVMASIQSGHGRATVHLTRVELGGIAVSGAPLDFLIQTFFMPLYPDARIDQPFELADGVDRIEVTPAEARAYIRK
ncbi:MAG TPA: hypothetical protein VLW25_10160 [Bryobacteraceae bacterium]|nr:hypothetical protein [Bryobacteraceae bacterium]